jgi:hypothetical protein
VRYRLLAYLEVLMWRGFALATLIDKDEMRARRTNKFDELYPWAVTGIT